MAAAKIKMLGQACDFPIKGRGFFDSIALYLFVLIYLMERKV
jgi:hypothetical protein